MGLIGLVIASVVNMFLQSAMMQWVVSIIGVLIWCLLFVRKAPLWVRLGLVALLFQLKHETFHWQRLRALAIVRLQ